MSDLSLHLLRHGYAAIERDRHQRGGGPTYSSRMLGRRAVVVAGERGARLFYDEDVVQRTGAVPPPLAWLLFGRGAVHGLDGEEHRRRKDLFLGPLDPPEVAACAEDAGERLAATLVDSRGEVNVHDALVTAYGGAVLHWAGVRVGGSTSDSIALSYAQVVDGFGFAGPAYLRAWLARRRTDAWARRLIDDVRAGRVDPPSGSVLARIAATDLDTRTAAVELGNVLRPTVAVSWLGTWAVRALDERPDQAPVLAEPGALHERCAFAEEVRRTTPFVPALAGRVRRAAELDGVRLRPGDRIVLDVRGINLDPASYYHADAFEPERFRDREPTPYDLVPQGGGPLTGHRCPGESLTLQLLAETLRVVAETGLRITSSTEADLTRLPTLPGDGLRGRVEAPARR